MPRSKKPKRQTRSLVPMPPPAVVVTARGKKTNRNGNMGTQAKAKIQELTEALRKKQTSGVHIAAGVGGAVGCTLTGALIVGKGWMNAKWASLLLTSIGAGTTFAGWRYDNQSLLWAGAGWTCAGAAHTTMALVVDARRAGEAKQGTEATGPRNAAGNNRDSDLDAAHRLRLTEDRARELERELARARRRMHPETELAAAA